MKGKAHTVDLLYLNSLFFGKTEKYVLSIPST